MDSHSEPLAPLTVSAYNGRCDFVTARTIDQTLGVQACYGTYCAAVLLRNKGVDISVALRLLTRPDQLRKPAPPDMFQPRMYGCVLSVVYRHTYA